MKNILLFLVGLATLTLFVSCENFLKSQSVRDEILAAIEYNNAHSYSVIFKSDADKGEFLPEGEKLVKIGYEVEVQFTPNLGNYKFVNLEAVSRTDQTQSLADYIEIKNVSVNDKTGVYIYKVKLLKETNEILIRPKCLELPSVTASSPAFVNAGSRANEPIIVNFNMQMEALDVTPENSIFNFDNISLIYTDTAKNNTDMSSYFETPVFDSQKKILTIRPKPTELKTFINNRNYIDINISFSSEIKKVENETELFLKQDEKSNFKVRYVPSIETTKPVKVESKFFATMEPITLETANFLPTEKKISDDNARIKDSFYIYGCYYDADSGVKKITVSQKGSNEIHEYTAQNAQFKSDENGNTEFCLKFDLELFNNAYDITVVVEDACENKSESETFTIENKNSYEASDFYIEISNDPKVWSTMGYSARNEYFNNLISSFNNNPQNFDEFMADYNSRIKQFRIYNLEANLLTQTLLMEDGLKVYCEYTDKTGTLKKEEFKKQIVQNDDPYLYIDLDVDSIVKTTIKLIITDSFGAQGEVDIDLRCNAYLYHYVDSWMNFSDYQQDGYLISVNYEDGNDYDWDDLYYGKQFHLTSGYVPVGFFVYRNWSEDDNAAELEGQLYYDFMDMRMPEEGLTVTDYIVTQDEKRHAIITFNLNDYTAQNYDYVYMESGSSDYYDDYNEILSVDKEDKCITFKFPCNYKYDEYSGEYTYLFGSKYKFRLTGYLDYYHPGIGESQTIEYEIDALDEKVYDDMAPVVTVKCTDYDYFTFVLEEIGDGSGLKDNDSGNLTKGGYYFRKSNSYTCKVPVRDLYNTMTVDGSYYKFSYRYNASDVIGNSVTDKSVSLLQYGTASTPWVKSIDAENNKIEFGNDYVCAVEELYVKSANDFPYGYYSYKWNKIQIRRGVDDEQKYIIAGEEGTTEKVLEGKFIKLCQTDKEYHTRKPPLYKYVGSPSSGNYDYMMPVVYGKNSMLISSDAPVLIHHISTMVPYEICKDWSVNEWCLFGIEHRARVFDFSTDDPGTQVFDYDDLYTGCNVIIAHFASDESNGKTIMSEIMQK